MLFVLNQEDKNYLLSRPETGMGYQVIEASKTGTYTKNRYIVLNAQMAIDIDGSVGYYVNKVMKEGIRELKNYTAVLNLSVPSIKLFNEKEYRAIVNEPTNSNEKGAIDNPTEYSDGNEVFVRLSAFEDDLRVDKINKRLLAGSFTTTMGDYKVCKSSNLNPIDRYALPNDEEIKWAFHIQPKNYDPLKRGTVQPANGKRGGGKEVYFENGTSNDTYLKTTPY